MQVSAGAVGSLTHAAPELLDSRCNNTPQSDVYAFGVLMYEIITGKEPFKGLSVSELILLKTTTDTADTLVMDPGDDRVYGAFAAVRARRFSPLLRF
jgi:serine/threonine protein kinase